MKKSVFPLLLFIIFFWVTSCKKDVSTTPAPVVVMPPVVIPVQISIYPNPCIDHFTIQTNVTTSQAIQISNASGQIILTQVITGTTNIATDTFTNGIYYIKITTNGSVKTMKIVVIH